MAKGWQVSIPSLPDAIDKIHNEAAYATRISHQRQCSARSSRFKILARQTLLIEPTSAISCLGILLSLSTSTMMSNSMGAFRSALQSFESSSSSFKIVRTIPESAARASVTRLFVLDSSFNPPTRAHLRIVGSALRASHDAAPARVLLLLATQNADKVPKPAGFEQRLGMMSAFAQDVLEDVKDLNGHRDSAIDIGVTKMPYFVDKSKAIAKVSEYQGSENHQTVSQVHLVGYDTLIRILNPKYYPPDHTLDSLEDLFEEHSLRVTLRMDEDFESVDKQRDYVERLKVEPSFAAGWRTEWGKKVEIDESKGGEEAASSTKAREAAERGQNEKLEDLCTSRVIHFIKEAKPYPSTT